MGDVPDAGKDHPRIKELNDRLRFDDGKERFAWFVRMGPAIELRNGQSPPYGYSVHRKVDYTHGFCYWLTEEWWWTDDLMKTAQFGSQKEAEKAAVEVVLRHPKFIGKVDAIPLGIPYNPLGDPRDVESCSPKTP